MFIPIEEKLKKIIPDLNQREEFDHYVKILPKEMMVYKKPDVIIGQIENKKD